MLINNRPISFLYRLNDIVEIRDSLEEQILPKYTEFGSEFILKIDVELEECKIDIQENLHILFQKEENIQEEVNNFQLFDLLCLKTKLLSFLSNFRDQKEMTEKINEQCLEIAEQHFDEIYKNPLVYDHLKELLKEITYENYFARFFKRHNINPQKYDFLKGKELYVPKPKHTWVQNSEWLISRFKEGCIFVILSIVSEENTQRKKSESGSGFQREIAACLIHGYNFKKFQQESILVHANIEKIQHLEIEDLFLGKDLTESIYEGAIIQFKTLNIVITTMGIIKSQILTQNQAKLLYKDLKQRDMDFVFICKANPDSYYLKAFSRKMRDLKIIANVFGLFIDKSNCRSLKTEVSSSHFASIITEPWNIDIP